MSRLFQRSSLLLLVAALLTACSGGPTGGVTPPTPDANPVAPAAVPNDDAASDPMAAQAKSRLTIQGPVTSISTTPYFHVVAAISGKGSVPIYSSELKSAKIGSVVKATGFYNSLGNFQASSASIVSTSGATAAPSPTPGATPTVAPSPPPVRGAGGVAGVVKLFQIFDFKITGAQSASAAKNEDAVWGAGDGNVGALPSTWLSGNPDLAAIQYVVQPTDYNPVSHHTVAWFQTNHPDWIVYDCNANNQPTHTVAYQPGLAGDVPLDIHNPDVVKYQIQTAGNFAIAHHANAIGADQTLFFDYDGGQNAGWYGCGIYQDGRFVRRWGASGGGFPNHDPQWNRDVAAWAATAKEVLATDATLAPHHLKLFVNHPHGSIADANEQTLIANVDGILDETGFVDYGRYSSNPNLFSAALAYMEYVQHQGKTILENAKFSGSLVGDSSNFGLADSQIAYAISTYLIGNEGHASLFITPGPYGALYKFSQIATINSQLGSSCGSYTTAGSVYIRKFTHGMVVVNPNRSYASLSLDGSYSDAMGRPVTGKSLNVGPGNGYVLLGSSGC